MTSNEVDLSGYGCCASDYNLKFRYFRLNQSATQRPSYLVLSATDGDGVCAELLIWAVIDR